MKGSTKAAINIKNTSKHFFQLVEDAKKVVALQLSAQTIDVTHLQMEKSVAVKFQCFSFKLKFNGCAVPLSTCTS